MMNTTTKAPKAKALKDWACQECGKLMTLAQAERATYSITGCTKCGSSDIFLASPEQMRAQR